MTRPLATTGMRNASTVPAQVAAYQDGVARLHLFAVLHHHVRVDRHDVLAADLAVGAADFHRRLLLLVGRVDDVLLSVLIEISIMKW